MVAEHSRADHTATTTGDAIMMTDHSHITYDSDREMHVLGVLGRLTHRTIKPGVESRWHAQRWISEARPATCYADDAQMRVTIRFDDELNNGHATFVITCDVFRVVLRTLRGKQYKRIEDIGGGAAHDDIARLFPELAPLMRWHLVSTDGPMHYLANTVYLAGDRDHRGLRQGETKQRFNAKGQPLWEMVAVHAPGVPFILSTTVAGDAPPPAPMLEWRPLTHTGEGKARELDSARLAAVWPEATDDDLMQEPDALRAALLARLPALLAAFRSDMERAGFFWSPADYRAPETAEAAAEE